PEHLRDEQDVPTATERPEGPYDISEIESREFSKGYMDLGTIKVPMRKNVSYRLEQEQAKNKVFAVSAVHENSTLQIQAFAAPQIQDRKSTRLNSSHVSISYAVFCLKKKKKTRPTTPQHTRQKRHKAPKARM